MAAAIIDGNAISAMINTETATAVSELLTKHNVRPGLAVILIGENPASKVYVGRKVKKCEELGIFSKKIELPAETSEKDVLAVIDGLNKDPQIHGILVQFPPPAHISEKAVIDAIDPKKDVDCFHPVNIGKMLIGERDGFFPCTPYGVMLLLEKSGVNPAGKHVVVLGRSNIVGKPMMALMVQKAKGADATVTVCHSGTKDLKAFTRQADILVAAIGKPCFVKAEMVKEGAVVIDVGINKISDPSSKTGSRLVGDVDYEQVAPLASMITPVPGGVGPMTIAVLMQNTVKACKASIAAN